MASLSKLNRVVCACSGINIFLTYNNNIETLSRVMYIVHSKKKKNQLDLYLQRLARLYGLWTMM